MHKLIVTIFRNSGCRLNQRPQFLELFLFYTAVSHPKHYNQCKAAAKFHFLDAANIMFLKTKRFIKPTVDTLNAGTFFVDVFPFITAAGKGRKYSWVTFNVDPDIVADAAAVFAYACKALMFPRAAIFQSVAILFESSKSHLAFFPFNRAMAINRPLVIMAYIILAMDKSCAIKFP